MANPSTVGEDFQVNGTSLYTLAYNVWTLAGREQAPPVIGDNLSIPYRPGRIWVPKTFDQRTITLGMWVKGTDVNGVIPAAGARAQFNSNLRTLKRLFAPRGFAATGPPLTLSRTLKFVTGTETHTALADAYNPSSGGFTAGGGSAGTDQWDLTPVTISYGTFSIDLVMADPWWYGAQSINTFGSAGGAITNLGDVEAFNMLITFTGPLTNPVLTNTTNGVAVWYNAAIASGDSVQLNAALFDATDIGSGSSVIGTVFHSGHTQWMLLEPGVNAMTLTRFGGGAVGAGSVTVTFNHPYT